MKHGVLLLVASIMLALSGCATTPEESSDRERYEVWQEADHIVYRGLLLEDAVNEVAELLREHGESINYLAIESPGGDVMIGMDLGELVHEYGLGVKVFNSGCHSSCANYVFTSGGRKVIGEGSLVTWHGSALQRNLVTRVRRSARTIPRRMLNQIKVRQREFFERIGVDARITIVGQDLKCECVWALSAEDMSRFGLTNVEVPDDYTQTDVSAISENPYMRFLELPEDVFGRIRSPEDV
jgi:hypothetical protein